VVAVGWLVGGCWVAVGWLLVVAVGWLVGGCWLAVGWSPLKKCSLPDNSIYPGSNSSQTTVAQTALALDHFGSNRLGPNNVGSAQTNSALGSHHPGSNIVYMRSIYAPRWTTCTCMYNPLATSHQHV
jgi:hypothetical protein